jgi:pimeloyl-ACP methyl ester carboxylesterase
MAAFTDVRVAACGADIAVRTLGAGPTLVSCCRSGTPEFSNLCRLPIPHLLPELRGMGASTAGGTPRTTWRDIAAVMGPKMAGRRDRPRLGNRTRAALASSGAIYLVALFPAARCSRPRDRRGDPLAQAVNTPADIRAEAVRARGSRQAATLLWLTVVAAGDVRLSAAAATGGRVVDRRLKSCRACAMSARRSATADCCREIGARATLVELADVGHALPVERPALVANTVIDFMRSRIANRSNRDG